MSKGHWKKPVTKIYDSNYRQGENMYKDQIDRLDNKEKPRSRFGVSFGDLSGSGLSEQPSSARRLSDDFMTSFRNRDGGSSGERPRFNFGDRILDAVGVSEGSNRPGPITSAINSMDEDPFFQTGLRNRQAAPRSADSEFFGSDDPFKRRSNAVSSARERADEMMNEMKKDSAEMMSSMRSRRSEMSRNESESQGQSKLDMIGQRAKARLANLANYDDELNSPLMSSRLNASSDLEASGGQSRSVRISKRSIKSTYETS